MLREYVAERQEFIGRQVRPVMSDLDSVWKETARHSSGLDDNAFVKVARPPLVQSPKGGTGGTSGLHRTAQEVTPLHREVRIRATETSRLSAGETGNLCAQQHQVGQR